MAGISISISGDLRPEEVTESARACLQQHTEHSVGALKKEEPLSVLAFDDGRLVGGMIGKVFYNWLYAEGVWVEEGFRGQGIGTQIMKATEDRARAMKLVGIYLWTESWQAPRFYTALGYLQFVEFKNCPPGHSRFGFRKYLV
jgi:GNAT superfamily N-acetyltransferase